MTQSDNFDASISLGARALVVPTRRVYRAVNTGVRTRPGGETGGPAMYAAVSTLSHA